MSKLPVITSPVDTFTIPSTGKQVKFRPFKVKEERLLLMAMESGKLKEIVSAIGQVVTNCTFGEVDPETLSSFDLEWFFLKLRIASKGERQHLEFPCQRPVMMPHEDTGEDTDVPLLDENGEVVRCGKTIRTAINLKDARIDKIQKGANKIMLSDNVGMILRYPGFDLFTKNNLAEILDGTVEETATEMLVKLILSNIESIFEVGESNTVYDAKDFTEQQLLDYIDDMPDFAFEKIKEFFTTLPKVKLTVSYSCSCTGGKEYTEEVEGIQNFLR